VIRGILMQIVNDDGHPPA